MGVLARLDAGSLVLMDVPSVDDAGRVQRSEYITPISEVILSCVKLNVDYFVFNVCSLRYSCSFFDAYFSSILLDIFSNIESSGPHLLRPFYVLV